MDEDEDCFVGAEDTEEVLKTEVSRCKICGVGDVVKRDNGEKKILVYGRTGVKKVTHEEYRCNFRRHKSKFNPNGETCGAGYYYGYTTFIGMKIYDDDALMNNFLVATNQTTFEVDFLIEFVGQVEISSMTFQAKTKCFNRFVNFHLLPQDTRNRRESMNEKRISIGYYTYCYLECGQRYNISNYQIIKTTLDAAILEHKEEFTSAFREKWTLKHRCNITGCKVVITADGGLKPFRKLCGAKLNGIKEFKISGKKILTGCTAMCQPTSKYCHEHEDQESPVRDTDNITETTKTTLRNHRKATQNSNDAGQDDLYIIESIEEVSNKRGVVKYKVKWVGFPKDLASWEPEDNIPKFVKQYYKDQSKVKMKLPNPHIKHSKTLSDGTKYHFLSWEGEKDGEWLHESWFDIAAEDGDIVFTNVQEVTCNTRKSRDKRERRCMVLISSFHHAFFVVFSTVGLS